MENRRLNHNMKAYKCEINHKSYVTLGEKIKSGVHQEVLPRAQQHNMKVVKECKHPICALLFQELKKISKRNNYSTSQ